MTPTTTARNKAKQIMDLTKAVQKRNFLDYLIIYQGEGEESPYWDTSRTFSHFCSSIFCSKDIVRRCYAAERTAAVIIMVIVVL